MRLIICCYLRNTNICFVEMVITLIYTRFMLSI